DSSDRQNDEWTATTSWTVTGTTNLVAAMNAVPMAIGNSHPDTSALHCTGLSPKRLGVIAWLISATFSSRIDAQVLKGDNPLSEPIMYGWDFGLLSFQTGVDADGNLLTTSSREPRESS